MMNPKLRELLDQVPERPPRSKLEPHAEVIRELRRKRRTYQEIAAFLREHVQLSVAPSTIHEFVKTRARRAHSRAPAAVELPPSADPKTSSERISPAPASAGLAPANMPARERIRAVKNQSVVSKTPAPRFEFDPQSPLTLKPKPKEN